MSAISGPNGSTGIMDLFLDFSDQIRTLIDKVPGIETDDILPISRESQEI